MTNFLLLSLTVIAGAILASVVMTKVRITRMVESVQSELYDIRHATAATRLATDEMKTTLTDLSKSGRHDDSQVRSLVERTRRAGK